MTRRVAPGKQGTRAVLTSPLEGSQGNLALDGPAWLHLDPDLAGSSMMDGWLCMAAPGPAAPSSYSKKETTDISVS